MNDTDSLIRLLAQLSYRRGTFRLASGRESDFYVDVKQTAMQSKAARVLGRCLAEQLQNKTIACVGGMAVGAVPLVSLALSAAADRDYALDGFFVRKEIKDHGTGKRLDGRFNADARIALLEDVVTTGESTLAAIDAVEEAGGVVSLIITVVDREENQGMAALRQRVPEVRALATRSQIMAVPDS